MVLLYLFTWTLTDEFSHKIASDFTKPIIDLSESAADSTLSLFGFEGTGWLTPAIGYSYLLHALTQGVGIDSQQLSPVFWFKDLTITQLQGIANVFGH